MKKITLALFIVALFVNVSMTSSYIEGRLKQLVSGESYTTEEIADVKNLTVLYTGNEAQFEGDEYKVTGLSMLLVPKVGTPEAFESANDLISETAKTHIKTILKPGDKILFDNIRYTTHNGEIHTCSPVYIFIK